jgi:hypothetical protein
MSHSTVGALIAALMCSQLIATPVFATKVENRAPDTQANKVIVKWNELAYDIAFAHDQFTTFKGQRAMAIMHLAQHDALNAVSPRYETYILTVRMPQADPHVATAQAARDVLLSEYPHARPHIDSMLQQQLSTRPASKEKHLGIQLGHAAASAILDARAQDRWGAERGYEFSSEPGTYQTTPDWRGFVLDPGLAHVQPFFLKHAADLRPLGPPALSSRSYARAYREVKMVGEQESRARRQEQTFAAVWWMEFSEGLINRLARDLVVAENLELWRAARLFALMNAGLVDSYVAVWDAKYHFNHWRPYTAIRNAARDRNRATAADLNWNSLRPAPPFPEYPSAHAAGCACTLTLLEHEFPQVREVTLSSLTSPSGIPSRSFDSFEAAAYECAQSRIWLGFHFRYSTRDGSQLGRESAKHALRFLRPRRKGR